jgi:hypothetical protein|tara:strand:+ start:249 stop:431 length:183 start_codon:yes stop_codon:yes gene_type:complete
MNQLKNSSLDSSSENSVRSSMKKLNLQLDKIDVLDAARIRIEIMRLINSLADTMNLKEGV